MKIIFTFFMVFTGALVAHQQEGVMRIYLPTKAKDFSMILLDTTDNKPVTKEIYNWIQPFIKVQKANLAKASKSNKKIGFING